MATGSSGSHQKDIRTLNLGHVLSFTSICPSLLVRIASHKYSNKTHRRLTLRGWLSPTLVATGCGSDGYDSVGGLPTGDLGESAPGSSPTFNVGFDLEPIDPPQSSPTDTESLAEEMSDQDLKQQLADIQKDHEECMADIRVFRVHQKSSASSYAEQFLDISRHLKWTDAAYMAIFENGLKFDVKDILCVNKRPETLSTLIERAIKIDSSSTLGKEPIWLIAVGRSELRIMLLS
ncbi:uncharacterized protein An08g12120 [Aspergillus niger]|uniref:Contig An08c0330, genomic contig n=3 Tax=Aspergillus niger TaxID=5061 RepID=A2QSW0_ASPNC|nr:uncharacterized protein An08g12120 [Aspergillus niger]CAK40088.1 unnamed protein product [Aspergillus niger]